MAENIQLSDMIFTNLAEKVGASAVRSLFEMLQDDSIEGRPVFYSDPEANWSMTVSGEEVSFTYAGWGGLALSFEDANNLLREVEARPR